ncbi:hotdog family protein [Photobacterium sp. TY1-4]|uniref:hotdog family protein n=1 Tax=Photobacterium sp. TY1-4 TaxID=2899122 RepID=UPI0021C1A352|nr:hotdog family protein [Photobacterium sp. TY1-4]UXI03741.1 hotdog family protein [Photobacterium sp. TY1-4]
MTHNVPSAEIPPLSRLLPHDTPMILLDTLIAVSDSSVHCQLTPTATHFFFDANAGELPGYVGIELMAQAVAAWDGYHAWLDGRAPAVGFLLGSRQYQASCPAFPVGQLLDIYAEQVTVGQQMVVFRCRIEQSGQVLASSQLNVFVPSPAQLAEMETGSES